MRHMESSVLFRYEKKYIIDNIQLEEQRMRINAVCESDPHAGENGLYNIRSLYFDDYCDSGLVDNEIGIEPRSKWRLRIYNHNDSLIHLEHKIKEQGKIYKESTEVTRDFCCRFLENPDSMDYPVEDRVINRFLTECFTRGLRPKIIVEYDREPYVCDEGDVRITFDRNICCSNQVDRFFEKDLFLCPVMSLNQQLMEVKYSEFLPSHIHRALDTGRLQQSTFSKYYLSRKL